MDLETKQKIDALLSGFKELDLDRLDQTKGSVFKKDGECGACVGAWAAVFLDLPRHHALGSITIPSGEEISRWWYEDGVEALEDIFGEDVDQLFRECGSGTADPFGPEIWIGEPYSVIKQAAFRGLGYKYQPEGEVNGSSQEKTN